MVIWITGLSGAGKSTIANGLAARFNLIGIKPLMIDGDDMRDELCSDLGFSDADRAENIRRAGAVSQIAARSGIVSVCSLISPIRTEREKIRDTCKANEIPFIEIYLSAPLKTCEERDTKGLYKKARNGAIPAFTGISSPYEPPAYPDLEIPSHNLSIVESVESAWRVIEPKIFKQKQMKTNIPRPYDCHRCGSTSWKSNPYHYLDCGMKKPTMISWLWQKQTEECKRREVAKLVRQALKSLNK
jgi:adenylylsulfate kinase